MSAATVVLVTAVGAHPDVIQRRGERLPDGPGCTRPCGAYGTCSVPAARKTGADRRGGAGGDQTFFLDADRAPVRAALSRGLNQRSGAGLVNQTANQGTIVVFRIQLLPPSETFIVAQAAAMRRFSPFFVGWRRTAGIDLPQDTSWTVDGGGLRGKLRELRFRYAGPTREQVARYGRALRAWSMRISLPMATRRCSLRNSLGCRW